MSDIYTQRNNWKIVLAAIGSIILVITLFYSNYLAGKLEENELKNAKLYSDAISKLNINDIDPEGVDYNKDVDADFAIINSFSQPLIMKNEAGGLEGFNFENESDNKDSVFLSKKVKEFLASGKKPFLSQGYHKEIYFFNTPLLDYIRWYPLLQLMMVGSFVGLGFFLFNSTKRAEQNRVWAGMAKETAHQLGTPISAIMGWVTYLKETYQDDEVIKDISLELEKDVDRLNLVADRFSKIGSAPDLKEVDLNEVIHHVVSYMQRRASKSTSFDIKSKESVFAKINNHLFEWVIENLIRNSLDAMDGKGKIEISLYSESGQSCIDIKDTGKGIPSSKLKTIFNPGYSTKQRGWGLGLSLAKRIIEEYHKGKIYVKDSRINEGTTFTIRLIKEQRPS
jgi:two-component sensor histidine kinase